MGDLGGREPEAVPGVGQEAGPRQEGAPPAVLAGVESRQGGLGGGVELQVRGVDLGEPDHAGRGEPDHRPVVAAVAAARRLPALGLVAGEPGEQHVVGRGVEPVRALDDAGAVLQGRQVDGQAGHVAGVGDDVAVHAEPRDAAVREHVQPDVGGQAFQPHGEGVGAVALQRALRDDLRPVDAGQVGRVAVHRAGLDGRVRRVVALEPGGVDDDAADHAGHAEADQRPVVAGAAAAGGLPPVVDLPFPPERRRGELGLPRVEEVLLLGERLVAGRDDRSAERADGQVREGREVREGRGVRHRGSWVEQGSWVERGSGVSSRPAGAAPTGAPRSQVARTTPVSVRPS